jgi:hypothetical protein
MPATSAALLMSKDVVPATAVMGLLRVAHTNAGLKRASVDAGGLQIER